LSAASDVEPAASSSSFSNHTSLHEAGRPTTPSRTGVPSAAARQPEADSTTSRAFDGASVNGLVGATHVPSAPGTMQSPTWVPAGSPSDSAGAAGPVPRRGVGVSRATDHGWPSEAITRPAGSSIADVRASRDVLLLAGFPASPPGSPSGRVESSRAAADTASTSQRHSSGGMASGRDGYRAGATGFPQAVYRAWPGSEGHMSASAAVRALQAASPI
jgi:hypothetical protein